MGHVGRNGARWLLLGALIYAPLAFGCTRPEPKLLLTFVMLAITVLFVIANISTWRYPRLPLAATVLIGGILFYGWGMILNARQEFDPNLNRFFNLEPLFGNFPGVVDRATAVPHMLIITGLMGAFAVACDAVANPLWRNRLWLTICLTGSAVMALGLAGRLTGLDTAWLKTSFATYPYHGNAGAFINLVLPFVAYRSIEALDEKKNHYSRAFWCMATLVTAACGFVNVSKAGAAITALLLAAMGLQQILARSLRRLSIWRTLSALGFLTILIGILGWSFGFDRAWQRWMALAAQLTPDNSRLLVYGAIWKNAVPASGLWGFGPGTFQITFPFFCNSLGNQIAGIWRYAHDDYLQALMEWGWAGTSLWVFLIGGGLLRAMPGIPVRANLSAMNSPLGAAAFFSMAGICIHAVVDFPLQIPSLQLYVAVSLGFLWSCQGTHSSSARRAIRLEPEIRNP